MNKSLFLNKKFPQKCGDTLLVLGKNDIKKFGHDYYYCQFLNYPCVVECRDSEIKKGTVVNPQIEQVEFIQKIWPQNCGDSLKVIEKVKIQKEKRNIYNWKCEFIKYPCEVIASKDLIVKGKVNNPQIDIEEFIGKEYPQNCGDTLKVVRKSNIQNSAQTFLYECEFIKYPNIVFVEKESIINGLVRNLKLPLYDKVNLIKFIEENFKEKPTCKELSSKLNVSVSHLSKIIRNLNIYDYINTYKLSSFGEDELRNFIQEYFSYPIRSSWEELNGQEIDIYLPDLKIGFEFNGIYWHSDKFKNKNYHLDKLKLANSKGIKLYFIWQDEWENNKEEIKDWLEDIIFDGKSDLFNKEIDKIGFLDNNFIRTEPILINREGFLCYNCGYILN